MRITKDKAAAAAIALTAELGAKIETKQNELIALADIVVSQKVPKEFAELRKKYAKYFKFNRSFNITVEGVARGVFVQLDKAYPAEKEYGNQVIISDHETVEQLTKMETEIWELENRRENLIKEIEATLYSLRTYNRVAQEFPEAVEFLPKQETTALVNLDSLKTRLAHQTDLKVSTDEK